MAEKSQETQEVVIVKVRRHDPELEGGHTGVWKLAYADFVTAMMAFFLLMWLVNATTKEQRDGISNYFNPVSVSTGTSGTDGLLAGRTTDTQGSLDAPDGAGRLGHPMTAPPYVSALGTEKRMPQGAQMERGTKPKDEARDLSVAPMAQIRTDLTATPEETAVRTFDDPFGDPNEAIALDTYQELVTHPDAPEKLLSELEVSPLHERAGRGEDLEALRMELLARLTQLLEDNGLTDNVRLNIDKDGLRIQITDDNKFSMFPVGSARLENEAAEIVSAITQVIRDIPNGIMITGHTDALPYRTADGYSNWELSADRANAARRALVEGGMAPDRILRVEGHGDRTPLIEEDAFDARNRRITILVLASQG